MVCGFFVCTISYPVSCRVKPSTRLTTGKIILSGSPTFAFETAWIVFRRAQPPILPLRIVLVAMLFPVWKVHMLHKAEQLALLF